MHAVRNTDDEDLFTFIVACTILPHSTKSGILVTNVMSTMTTATGTRVRWHGQAGLEEHIAGQGEPGLNDPVLAARDRWHCVETG